MVPSPGEYPGGGAGVTENDVVFWGLLMLGAFGFGAGVASCDQPRVVKYRVESGIYSSEIPKRPAVLRWNGRYFEVGAEVEVQE
jgi:hypothetical protein